ncbi:MAG TPA: hypothetical protein VMY80_14005 [Anaerolineae bacterium]|nr:hypothetical protein [Anaerolineae bacterium]
MKRPGLLALARGGMPRLRPVLAPFAPRWRAALPGLGAVVHSEAIGRVVIWAPGGRHLLALGGRAWGNQ